MGLLNTDEVIDINLMPETEEEDVSQCIAMICNTPKGSVPFMRDFGISSQFMHSLAAGCENDIAEEVADQIEEYESRAEAEDIEFEDDEETGGLIYTVPYTLKSEEEEDD